MFINSLSFLLIKFFIYFIGKVYVINPGYSFKYFFDQVFNPLIRPLNHKDVEKFVLGSTQHFINTANIAIDGIFKYAYRKSFS